MSVILVAIRFGIGIFLVLGASYFVNINISSGNSITQTSLLGILIFYNPFILALYLLIAIVLIMKGIKTLSNIKITNDKTKNLKHG